MDTGTRVPARSALRRRVLRTGAAGFCLLLALLSAAASCFPWQQRRSQPVYRFIAVVDITRSMNVEDYRIAGRTVSRLEFVRLALQRLVTDLPCGSRFGLGVFTERRSTLLFEPIETCKGFSAIAAALRNLDWRMAWAADSRIAVGLLDSLHTLGRYDSNLIFITDGQEAPPVNPRYRTPFDEVRGRMKGVLVGTGGLTPLPIPKFDEAGRRLGFVAQDEVPHRSTFGLSELPPEEIEGYHARNAPFGSRDVAGTEHLSALREDYLKQLASEAGLAYRRLETAEGLIESLTAPEFAGSAEVVADLRVWPAALALALLAAAFLGWSTSLSTLPADLARLFEASRRYRRGSFPGNVRE